MERFDGVIKVGRRIISNLSFADDIDLLAGSEERKAVLVISRKHDTNKDQEDIQYEGEILEGSQLFPILWKHCHRKLHQRQSRKDILLAFVT